MASALDVVHPEGIGKGNRDKYVQTSLTFRKYNITKRNGSGRNQHTMNTTTAT